MRVAIYKNGQFRGEWTEAEVLSFTTPPPKAITDALRTLREGAAAGVYQVEITAPNGDRLLIVRVPE